MFFLSSLMLKLLLSYLVLLMTQHLPGGEQDSSHNQGVKVKFGIVLRGGALQWVINLLCEMKPLEKCL